MILNMDVTGDVEMKSGVASGKALPLLCRIWAME